MSSDNELRREESHREISRDLRPVERTLAAFAPRPPQLDRDRLMFLAGAESVLSPADHGRERRVDAAAKRGAWLWPAATASLAATSLALAFALFLRPAPPVQIVVRERPTPPPAAAEVAIVVAQSTPGLPDTDDREQLLPYRPETRQPEVPANNYVRTREVALRMGVDALGSPRAAGGGSASGLTYIQWLAGLDESQPPPAEPMAAPLPNM